MASIDNGRNNEKKKDGRTRNTQTSVPVLLVGTFFLVLLLFGRTWAESLGERAPGALAPRTLSN